MGPSDAPALCHTHPRCFAVEVFAGSARLSLALTRAGLPCLALDSPRNQQKPVAPCISLDLTLPRHSATLGAFLSMAELTFVHFAPPCGTASRAREKSLPESISRSLSKVPLPLRSNLFPLGLPGLKGDDLSRVNAANVLYSTTAELCTGLHSLGKLFSVENPHNSLMWETPYFKRLSSLEGVFQVSFDHCMHGGSRPKKTLLITNCSSLRALESHCDSSHEHSPWGRILHEGKWRWATALETAYPPLLCTRWAAAIAFHLSLPPSAPSLHPLDPLAVSVDRQTKRAPPLLFCHFSKETQVLVSLPQEVSALLRWKSGGPVPASLAGINIHPKSRLLRSSLVGGLDGKSGQVFECRWALLILPEIFERKGVSARHPFDSNSGLEIHTLLALKSCFSLGPRAVQAFRLRSLARIKDLATSMDAEEAEAHRAMPEHVSAVMRGKRTRLFVLLAEEAGVTDQELLRDLREGCKLVGLLPDTSLFDRCPPRAHFPPGALLSISKLGALPSSCNKGEGDTELDAALWTETLEEVKRGWLLGPLSSAHLDSMFPQGWVASRRFPVKQATKIRPVDDFSASGVNMCCCPSYRLTLGGLDEQVAIAGQWVRAVGCGSWSAESRDGRVVSANVHSGWGRLNALRLLGRCLDLKAAYRQLAVRGEDLCFSVISLRKEKGAPTSFFVSRALPFGATAAVFAFNRVARALSAILAHHLAIPCGNFFDDYPVIEPESTASGSQSAAQDLLEVLGWVFAQDPQKCQPPSPKFDVLGATLDLSRAREGVICVDNKESRKAAILRELHEVVGGGELSAKSAASLRGKLLFFEGQLTGKCMVAATWCIGQLALGVQVERVEVRDRCAWLRDFLHLAPPREIVFHPCTRPVVIFTDGAAEDSGVSCGAVVCDPASGGRWVFHVPVPDRLVGHWRSTGSKQVISQAEMLPILLVLHSFPELLTNRRALVFVDNEGVRYSLIKGASRAELSRDLVLGIAQMVGHLCLLPWYLRVPSECNPADAPSRGDLVPALSVAGTRVVDIVWPSFLQQWVD